MRKQFKEFISSQSFMVWLFTMFVFGLFAYLSFLTPLAGDDWGYAVNGQSANPFQMALQFYFSWSGRYFSELYGFIVTPNKWAWNILNPLLFTSIFAFIVKLVEPKRRLSLLLLIVFLMLSVKDELRMETYTWLMGTTYVIPLCLGLWVFVQLKTLILDQDPLSIVRWILMSVSVFVIGLMMENIAAIMTFSLLVALVAYRLIRGKISIELCVVTAISLVSLALLRLSPGAAFRLMRDNADWIHMGMFKQVSINFPTFIQLTFIDHRFLMLALSLVLLAKTWTSSKTNLWCFKLPATLVLSLAFLSSLSLTLQARFPGLNLSAMTTPTSIYNYVFWPVFIVSVYLVVFKTMEGKSRLLSLFMVTISGLSNGIMMLSPIFGYRSSLYTVYFLIVVVGLLANSLAIPKKVAWAIGIILMALIAKSTQTLLYKYQLVARVHQLRLAEIAYYQDHPEVEEAWLLRYPIFTIHSGDIEENDPYHMDVFKQYYHLDPAQKLIFYFPDEAYEDYLMKNGY